jgi:hemoglobin
MRKSSCTEPDQKPDGQLIVGCPDHIKGDHAMSPATATAYNVPLFEKYGGLSVLRAVIFGFYDRVLDNDVVGHFFDDVDLPRLVDHQTKFFTMVLGGPATFGDDRLARAHSHLDVTHAHFDEVARLLSETLEEAGFDPEDTKLTLAAVERRRSLIVK